MTVTELCLLWCFVRIPTENLSKRIPRQRITKKKIIDLVNRCFKHTNTFYPVQNGSVYIRSVVYFFKKTKNKKRTLPMVCRFYFSLNKMDSKIFIYMLTLVRFSFGCKILSKEVIEKKKRSIIPL
jgi:hypothetical protein